MADPGGRDSRPSPKPDTPEVLARILGWHELPPAAQLENVVLELKKWQRDHADLATQGYHDRLQRACSRLAKAKKTSDPEAGFVFSWIALNALYGVRPEVFKTDWWKNEDRLRPSLDEQQDDDQVPRELDWFLWRICGLDVDRVLRSVIEENWDDADAIVGTRYLMSSFWSWKWQTENELERWAASSERTVKAAIGPAIDREKMYRGLREIIVWRLRVLRNQLFHGCATDTHSKRRAAGESELEAGSRLLGELVWAFLKLMATEAGGRSYWPPIPFPRANSRQHQRFDQMWLPRTPNLTLPRSGVPVAHPGR